MYSCFLVPIYVFMVPITLVLNRWSFSFVLFEMPHFLQNQYQHLHHLWWVSPVAHSIITVNILLHLGTLKVVALAIMSKSNLNNFWWIGTVVGLICVSAVLWQSLLACMSYRGKKWKSCQTPSFTWLINGAKSNCWLGQDKWLPRCL